ADPDVLRRFYQLVIAHVVRLSGSLAEFFEPAMMGKTWSADALATTVKQPLAALSNMKVFVDIQENGPDGGRSDLRVLRLLKITSEIPREALAPDYESNDLSVMEDLANNLASTAPIRTGAELHEHCQGMGLDTTVLEKVAHVGMSRLKEHETKSLAPKYEQVASTILQDKAYWSDWKASSEPEGGSKFFADHDDKLIPAVATLRETCKEGIVRGHVLINDIATMLTALGKHNVACGLRVYWAVSVIRYSFASVAKHLNGFDFSAGDLMSDTFVASWNELARQVVELDRLIASPSVDAAISEMGALGEHGLPAVPTGLMRSELDVASSRSKELLTLVTGRLSSQIHREGEKLERAIPNYQSFVVSRFDTEKCKDMFVDASWETFAIAWVNVSKMQGLGRSLNSPAAGGNFEQQHSSCILVASRALKAGKTFISVASTVKLILVTLPATARSERVPLIDAQIAKAKGTDLPRNLQDFLSREKLKIKSAESK
ncbi:unnamed protein product, partial [Prorocentrum cordatum]